MPNSIAISSKKNQSNFFRIRFVHKFLNIKLERKVGKYELKKFMKYAWNYISTEENKFELKEVMEMLWEGNNIFQKCSYCGEFFLVENKYENDEVDGMFCSDHCLEDFIDEYTFDPVSEYGTIGVGERWL